MELKKFFWPPTYNLCHNSKNCKNAIGFSSREPDVNSVGIQKYIITATLYMNISTSVECMMTEFSFLVELFLTFI